ncbi:MAG: YlmH/Sll1252 family protein [Desulfitobacterium hafniense]|nr:YlmH/Sll1252 family protein [Desulfitobacterium hafniense]
MEKLDRSRLGFWADKELKIQAAHILDLCEIVLRKEIRQITPFLTQSMSSWLQDTLERSRLKYLAAGGFADSERVRYVIGPSDEILIESDAEVEILHIVPVDSTIKLEHRHILGSLIGLGLKREVIGDILPGQTGVYVAITSELAGFLLREWDRVGSDKVRVSIPETELKLLPDEGEERRITVSSSRLDAVAAGGFGISRSSMQELIIQGKVKRNDVVMLKPDLEVHSGDIISCRGQGRLRLLETEGVTRKGRTAWKVRVFKAKH